MRGRVPFSGSPDPWLGLWSILFVAIIESYLLEETMSGKHRIPRKGRLLLSEPFLSDPNFRRVVILVAEHSAEGSLGFVLNKPIEYRLNEIVEDFPEFDAPVYLGGPVETDSLHFIHRIPYLADEEDEILPGLYRGSNFERLRFMIQEGHVEPTDVRFFIGYSGWAPNQLQDEMKSKTWIVSASSPKVAFSEDHESMWREILQGMGSKYKAMANYPEDPSLN